MAFADRSGNARAAVAGLCCISSSQVLQYNFDDAVASAREARSRAVDPFYLAWATFYEALALSWAGRVVESRLAIDELKSRGSRFWTILARPLDALTLMGEGHLSRGMAALMTELDRLHRTGSKWMECFCRSVLGRLYTDIACGEVTWDASTVLRNPGFALRHKWRAARRARAWLENYLEFLEDGDVRLPVGFVCIELARLDHHQHNPQSAREHLKKAMTLFRAQGASMGFETIRPLAAELGMEIREQQP